MIPGELFTGSGEIEINAGRPTMTLTVANTGGRPIQVGSHYHFYETNMALAFDRERARGYRLDIPAGTATRFEPGQSLVINKIDLAPLVGANLEIMERDAKPMRGERSFVFTNLKTGDSIDGIVDLIVTQGGL